MEQPGAIPSDTPDVSTNMTSTDTRSAHAVYSAQLRPAPQFKDVAFCASPSNAPSPRRKPANPEPVQSLGGMLRAAVVDHQLGLSLNLILLLALTYALFPSLRARVEPFFAPQYALGPGVYGQGAADVWIVLGLVVFFTALRALCLDYLFAPLADASGIRKRKGRIRFAEQSYLILYYVVFWTWGLVLFLADTPPLTAPTLLGRADQLLVSLWRGFPRLTLGLSMKLYYMSQTAFWVQQVLVIHVEERRKDHWQMLTHHFFTLMLLVFSYAYRQMRAGTAILVLMDVVDLVFSPAKILRYLGLQTACDIAFGLFVVLWLLARHIGYLSVMYSIYAHVGGVVMRYGTYSTAPSSSSSPTLLSPDGGSNILDNLLQPLLDPAAPTVQFNPRIRAVFLALLGGLQVITCIWFYMICRVVARVLRGEGADDSRSDDEDDEPDIPASSHDPPSATYKLRPRSAAAARSPSPLPRFIEVPADAADMHFGSRRAAVATASSSSSSGANNGPGARPNAAKKKSKGISSGLNLGEHKDILNRIGCLSEEQLARERERRNQSSDPRPGSSTGR